VPRLVLRSRLSEPPRSGVPPATPVHDDLRELSAAVLRRDSAALRTFLTAIVPDLIRVVRRVLGPNHPDVEDTAYEAAYGVVEALGRFRGEGTIRHLACRVAVLTAMNVRRRESAAKRDGARDDADIERVEESAAGPEERAMTASLVPIVRELVGSLPEPLAEALTLHVIMGYTVSEIAKASGAPVETIRSRLRLARLALRKSVLGNPRLREVLEVEP
jgi:RNA polymerase sigma factor (sigma-70 family)